MIDPEIHSLLDRVTHAELAGDVTALETLTTDDFALVGPLGFVLGKDEWLDRHRSGALTTEELAWQPESLRRHQGTAIAIGTQHQRSRYQGHAVEAHLRTTHVLVRLDDRWRLASTHLSPIGPPPASARPPQPTPAPPAPPDADPSAARPQ